MIIYLLGMRYVIQLAGFVSDKLFGGGLFTYYIVASFRCLDYD